jgi:hypothetical protein
MATVVPADGDLVPIGVLAKALGRSVRTMERWLERGLLPNPIKVNGQRYYAAGEVERIRQAAETSGAIDRQRRGVAFKAALGVFAAGGGDGPLSVDTAPVTVLTSTSEARPWQVEAQESTVLPWGTLSGESPVKTVGKLPSTCTSCGRTLSRRGSTDQYGRRWLTAVCDLHHDQGRVLWT